MSKYKVLYKNTLIFTISSFASKILGFLMLPLYTRVLSRGDFGSGDLVILTAGLLMPIFTVSIAEGALRFAMDENADNRQVFSFGLRLIGIGSIIMIILLPFVLMIPVIKDYYILLYLIFFSDSLNQFFNQFVRGINNIKLIGIVGVVQTLANVFFNILFLIIFDLGIEGLLLSIVLANIVALSILFYWGSLRQYLISSAIDKDLKKEMLAYCIPLTPNRLSWWLNNSANRYIISGYTGVSELGLFSAASRIPTILITFQGIFIQAWQLSAISEFKDKDRDFFFSKIYKLYNFVMLIGCSILILFIKPISSLLFGPEFKDAWKLAPFLLVSVIFGALTGFLSSINIVVKKTKSLFITTLIGAMIGVFINLIFIPYFGTMTASVSAIISFISIWYLRLKDTQKYIHLDIEYFKDITSYILVIVQSILIISVDIKLSTFYSLLCVLLILSLNYKTLFMILHWAIEIFRKEKLV